MFGPVSHLFSCTALIYNEISIPFQWTFRNTLVALLQQFSLLFATLQNIKKIAQVPQKHLTLVAVCMCINVPKRKCNGVKLGVWIISSRHKKYVPYNDVKAPLHKAMLAWLLFLSYQISVFYMFSIYFLDIIYFLNTKYHINSYVNENIQKKTDTDIEKAFS